MLLLCSESIGALPSLWIKCKPLDTFPDQPLPTLLAPSSTISPTHPTSYPYQTITESSNVPVLSALASSSIQWNAPAPPACWDSAIYHLHQAVFSAYSPAPTTFLTSCALVCVSHIPLAEGSPGTKGLLFPFISQSLAHGRCAALMKE